MQFDSVQELVAYYSNQADGLCSTLSMPCQLSEPPIAGLSRETCKVSEIERGLIYLNAQLGCGNFCDVWKGVWNHTTEVAVKVFKPGTVALSKFLTEVAVIKRFRHTNVVQVYGLCSQEEPIYMVLELMKQGSLLEYVRSDHHSLKLSQLIDMGTQVAAGMAYLESNDYIHRNLALRNILLSKNLICKVSDIGLTQVIDEDVYKAHTRTKFHNKQTAPEAVLYNHFTIKSDVWSFGILLYELITYGNFPYPGMNNAEVLEAIQQVDYHMPLISCPEQLCEMMSNCWRDEPASRPTFETLQWQLEDIFWLQII